MLRASYGWVGPALFLLVFAPLSSAGIERNQADPAARVANYVGIWMPDAAANAKLAKQTQHRLPPQRKRVGGGPGAPDGPGRKRIGLGKNGSAPGLIRPEMDFAAPLQGPLAIRAASNGIAMGKKGEPLVTLPFSGAIQLSDGKALAFAGWEGDALVVEINADEGVRITHHYSLEAQGTRLRLRTRIAGSGVPMPGGVDLERVFNRAPNDT